MYIMYRNYYTGELEEIVNKSEIIEKHRKRKKEILKNNMDMAEKKKIEEEIKEQWSLGRKRDGQQRNR